LVLWLALRRLTWLAGTSSGHQVAVGVLDFGGPTGERVHRPGDAFVAFAAQGHLRQAIADLHAVPQREVGGSQLGGLRPLAGAQSGARECHARVPGERLEQLLVGVRQLGSSGHDQAPGLAARDREGPGRRNAGRRDRIAGHEAGRADICRAHPASALPDVLPLPVEDDANGLARHE
jgi:hypothetical protein